jgi:streptogramin lyase
MTALKSLVLATALLASGASLVSAQTAPTTGGSPPVDITRQPNGAAAYTTQSNIQAGTRSPRHHKKMYMSAKGSHHKTLKEHSHMQAAPSSKQ